MIDLPSTDNFKLIRLDGTVYDMRENGILVNEFIVDSPAPIHSRETIEGRPGFIDMGTTYSGRTMHARCQLASLDFPDFPLFRDELFRMLDSREPFYLIKDNELGKRIMVKCDSSFSISRVATLGAFNIDFTSDSPYWESTGRTDTDPVDMDSDKWQSVGAGITLEDDLLYTWSQNSFRIYNGGDETVDPRLHELLIKYTGSSSWLKIENKTTGDMFQFNEPTASGDELELDGPRVLLNGVSSFSKSNRKLLTLAPGWNDIQLSGTGGDFQITFDFRWLYI